MAKPSQVRLSRLYRMLVSATSSAAIIGLTAVTTGATQKTAALLGAIAFFKDIQAYLSSAPGAPQHPQAETPPQEPTEP